MSRRRPGVPRAAEALLTCGVCRAWVEWTGAYWACPLGHGRLVAERTLIDLLRKRLNEAGAVRRVSAEAALEFHRRRLEERDRGLDFRRVAVEPVEQPGLFADGPDADVAADPQPGL